MSGAVARALEPPGPEPPMQLQVFAIPMEGDGDAIEEPNRSPRADPILSLAKVGVVDPGRHDGSIGVESLARSTRSSPPQPGARPLRVTPAPAPAGVRSRSAAPGIPTSHFPPSVRSALLPGRGAPHPRTRPCPSRTESPT
jgi:hypothetical protein